MDPEETNMDGLDRDCAEVPQRTPREVVSQEPQDMEIPEGAHVSLAPASREMARLFCRVRLESFEDLQTLGFIPRGLAQDRFVRALAEDDEAALKIAQDARQWSPRDCDGERSYSDHVRSVYQQIRKSHHPALAGLLSEHYHAPIAWDAPVAGIARKWFVSLGPSAISILVVALKDIIIHRNATLTVDARSKALLANHIHIHRTGRLVYPGGYLKIWASSIDLFDTFAIKPDQIFRPPWRVNQMIGGRDA